MFIKQINLKSEPNTQTHTHTQQQKCTPARLDFLIIKDALYKIIPSIIVANVQIYMSSQIISVITNQILLGCRFCLFPLKAIFYLTTLYYQQLTYFSEAECVLVQTSSAYFIYQLHKIYFELLIVCFQYVLDCQCY